MDEDFICQQQTLNPPQPYMGYSGEDLLRHYNPYLEMLPRRSLETRYASFRARLAKALVARNV